MAAVPDFGALASQQQFQNDDATRRTTWENRPDQYGPMGSIQWNQDPSGRWINSTNLSGDAQGIWNTTLAGQQNLGSQIANGLDQSGLPAMPDSGFGASQQVIDAWNALQRPGLDQNANAARARAAAMGITLGSNASNDIERTIGTNESEARNQGILRGTQEYGNVFNRGLSARQQAEKEAMDKYGSAMSGSASLNAQRESLNPNKWVSEVKSGVPYKPMDVYGAAADTFAAQRSNENIAQAQSNADRASTMGMVNSGLNLAGQIGWNNIGSGISGLWGGAKDLWNSWGSDPYGYGAGQDQIGDMYSSGRLD